MRLDRNSGCTIEALTSTLYCVLSPFIFFVVLRIAAHGFTDLMYAGAGNRGGDVGFPNRDSDVRSRGIIERGTLKIIPSNHCFFLCAKEESSHNSDTRLYTFDVAV